MKEGKARWDQHDPRAELLDAAETGGAAAIAAELSACGIALGTGSPVGVRLAGGRPARLADSPFMSQVSFSYVCSKP
jgi:hypothetical protein